MPKTNGKALVIFERLYSRDLSNNINKRQDSRVAHNETNFDITDSMKRHCSSLENIEKYLEEVYVPV